MACASATTGRPVASSGYHLTLAFAGLVAGNVRRALEIGAAHLSGAAFVCVLDEIARLGAGDIEALVPSQSPPALLGLADRLQRLVADNGGHIASRAYRPHVTLARFVAGGGSPARKPPEAVLWPAREYVLCQSRTDRPGSYDILAQWPLS